MFELPHGEAIDKGFDGSAMNEIIFQHGGTIDKFIGDAIMVMFGAPKSMPESEQAQKAVSCAMAMHEKLTKQPWIKS